MVYKIVGTGSQTQKLNRMTQYIIVYHEASGVAGVFTEASQLPPLGSFLYDLSILTSPDRCYHRDKKINSPKLYSQLCLGLLSLI